ncbi:MAG: hypothetical protein ACXVPN_09790 [Bacteroidia bacterium]
MKTKLFLFFLPVLLFSACSWIDAFYIINATDKPLAVEMILNKERSGIFKNDTLTLFGGEKKLDHEKRKNVAPTTLDNSRHYMVIVPAHTTLQIASMMNASRSHYTKEFPTTADFNLEELWIKGPGKEQKIIPATFNNFFKSGDIGRFDYKIVP